MFWGVSGLHYIFFYCLSLHTLFFLTLKDHYANDVFVICSRGCRDAVGQAICYRSNFMLHYIIVNVASLAIIMTIIIIASNNGIDDSISETFLGNVEAVDLKHVL